MKKIGEWSKLGIFERNGGTHARWVLQDGSSATLFTEESGDLRRLRLSGNFSFEQLEAITTRAKEVAELLKKPRLNLDPQLEAITTRAKEVAELLKKQRLNLDPQLGEWELTDSDGNT